MSALTIPGCFMIKRVILLCLCLALLVLPAHAEEYAKPDWPNLLRTLIRFNGISLDDDKTLDEYAIVTECDLYKTLYDDDFKWNQVRVAIRDSIKMNVATFPTSYTYKAELQLDRYDFQNKVFRLTPKTSIHNVNTLWIYQVDGRSCGGSVDVRLLPKSFRAVLDAPIFFDGIPLVQQDAEALLQQMKQDKNSNRIVTALFNMRVVYVTPMHVSNVIGDIRGYTQNGNDDPRSARLDVRLDSVEFYEDSGMTKLIYKLQP
jgi:hypothetical protein